MKQSPLPTLTRLDRPQRQRHQRRLSFIIVGCLVVLLGILAGVLIDAKRRHKSVIDTILAIEANTALPTPQPSPSPTAQLSPLAAEQPVPILMYHYIRDHQDPEDKIGAGLSVSPTVFRQQLKQLKALGYTTVTFKDLNKPLPPKPIILTFDDGYADAYTAALPIMQQEKATGAFYLVSEFLNKDRYITTNQAKTLAAAGMEIGSHTLNHKDLAKMGESDQEKQLAESKAKLEEVLGQPVTAFCYPAGRYNETTVQLAKRVGYASATTTKPGIAKGQDFTERPFELVRIRVTNQTDLAKVLKP